MRYGWYCCCCCWPTKWRLCTASVYTPKEHRVDLEFLKESRVSSILSENTQPSKGKSSMACCTLKAMPEFCSQDTLLMITIEAITLAEVSATYNAYYNEILATKQPLLLNARNSSLEVSCSRSINLDIAIQITKSYLDNNAYWFRIHFCREEEV